MELPRVNYGADSDEEEDSDEDDRVSEDSERDGAGGLIKIEDI